MRIANATPAAIRYACTHYHYSGSVPAVQYGYNVYNAAGDWCGVVCFGQGSNNHIGLPYGLCPGEVLELVRVALNGKQPATSQAVAAALRELHRQSPVTRLVVSYADADQGHIGTIYQATNWVYEGRRGGTGRLKVHGQAVHPRTIGSRGWRASAAWLREHIDPAAEWLKTKGKHKYLYGLDSATRKQVQRLAQPYPREENKETNGA